MIVQHHKERREQYSQILSTISKRKTPKLEASTFAITTRSGISTRDPPFPAPPRPATENFIERETEKEGLKGAKPNITHRPAPRPSILYPPSKTSNLPFPSRLKKQKKDDEDERLLSIFKQIHINLPFLEPMIHMAKGAKVLKDLLSHKEKLEKAASSVKLSEECSAIIQRRASINLMPHSLFRTLGISKLKPTKRSIQLADRSIKYPMGVCENLLVKVGKFIFPVDFVILKMDEDELVLIILGQPFLATARAMIDVHEGKLTLRVGNETITFNIGKSMKSKHFCDDYLYCADHTAKLMQEQWVDTVNHDGKWTKEDEKEDSNKVLAVSFYPRTEPVEPLEWKAPNNRLEPSNVEPPKLELKELPEHIEYAFLQEDNQLPVVISSALSTDEKTRLLEVLRNHKWAIAWSIADIKGTDSPFCTHKILMEDEFKPSVQPQRWVNPNIKEVVPKKGGMTIVKKEKDEIIPQRTITGWCMCIDYRCVIKPLLSLDILLPSIRFPYTVKVIEQPMARSGTDLKMAKLLASVAICQIWGCYTGGIDCLPIATIFEELVRMGIPIPSNDPLLSGKERMQLTKLMILCTNLQKQVLDLEKAKGPPSKGDCKDSLDAQEDASNQRRSFKYIDKDTKVSLVDEIQGRTNNAEMFDTDDLHGDEVIVDMAVAEKQEQSAKIDEITLAQTLIEIKAAPLPSEFRTTTSSPQASQPSKTKDKGKAIMINQKLQAKLIEEERLTRKKEEEANIALIESWENTQAMMEADRLLAERLQTREQEELTDEEKAKLFMEFMEKRREKKIGYSISTKKTNRPPTKTKKRNKMSIYLKHIGNEERKFFFVGYTYRGSKICGKVEDESISKKIENEEVEVYKEAELKEHMVKGIDREDLQTLWKLVKTKHGDTRPKDEHERVLWGPVLGYDRLVFRAKVIKNQRNEIRDAKNESHIKTLETYHANEDVRICFDKRGMLNPHYIRPFKICARARTVAIRLELPDQLSRVYSTFHVSNLKKCLPDETLGIPLDEIQIDDKLHFVEEPIEIMDREVKRLKQIRIHYVKVRWNSRRGPELTWEREDRFQKKYPHLIANFAPSLNATT
ncbi:DNA-directed DNA polymerase [Tanacetum coccineum]|uniref:DNA-directed DNA polymerase n=1 Tax=Tanacetum coccineum TaxID=301880 RepID=A0ABQ5AV73_9ASTR